MYNPPSPSLPPTPPPAEKSKTPLILGGCGALGCLGLLVIAGVLGFYAYKNQANSNSNTNGNTNKANSNSTRNDNRRDNTNSNRSAANGNTNSANENTDGDDQGEDNSNQSTDGGGADTANLAGTSWEGTDSDRDYFRFDFLPGGRLRVTPRDAQSRTGTWRMSGNNITMTASGLTWRGTVSPNEISGTGSDSRGHTWTWSLTRANN